MGAADTSCGERSFAVRCSDSGELEYAGNVSSAVAPGAQTCVPIQCNVSSVSSEFGMAFFRGGMYSFGLEAIRDIRANVGEMLRVVCYEGYNVKPSDFEGRFPLCSHPSSFTVTCDPR